VVLLLDCCLQFPQHGRLSRWPAAHACSALSPADINYTCDSAMGSLRLYTTIRDVALRVRIEQWRRPRVDDVGNADPALVSDIPL
jgi:hypothetical protein